jgi:AraC family transcriptional regulator
MFTDGRADDTRRHELAHVVDFVEGNLDRDLDLPSLASLAAMSVYHFAHRFKETVGVSPHAYLLTRRISRARGMLEHGENRLADVAAACGLSSQAHFTMAFRRVVGVTPGSLVQLMGRRAGYEDGR